MSPKSSLPIDDALPAILDSLRLHPNLVVEAPPGVGKTTRVPPALLGEVGGDVLVLEPRRIAARMAARRVAAELGEALGETVGYQIRFEEVAGPRTRLRFLTEGILTRRLLSDPSLKGVAAVVLDEFHERHLEGDLALALLKRLQRARPDLRIVVMSATLEALPVAEFLGDCPIVRAAGALFPLDIQHLPYSPAPLEAQMKDAVERLLRAGHAGDILAFLPGVAEIRRTMRECEPLARRAEMLVLPLHGSLPAREQDLALLPASQQKLIVATNVAESSVTVDGVTAVIDTGLARFARYSPWSGLPTLEVARISKASAKQRAGRAGRTAPGRVLRLYTEEDYARRPEHDAPEIVRSDLSQLCLTLRAMQNFTSSNAGTPVGDSAIAAVGALEWLDPPPPANVTTAESLLDRLGATGAMAKRMARYPLPPRLSRMLLESLDRGVGEDGCKAAALLAADTGSPTRSGALGWYAGPSTNSGSLGRSGERFAGNDLLAAMETEHRSAGSPGWGATLSRQAEQLRRIARPPRQERHDDNALLMSVLAGFPDHVARRRAGSQVLLSTGASAEIAGEPPRYEFMVAIDAEDRKDKPLPLIRMTARIEPEWLIDLFADHVREQSILVWNHRAERVDAVSTLLYDDLVIQESSGAKPDPEAAADLLAQKALDAGIASFVDSEGLAEFLARVEFAGFEQPDIGQASREMCLGLRSFAELKKAATKLIPALERRLGAKRLDEIAPARIRLPNGHQPKVHYERGKPPWIASRLQDYFGMRDTPRIGPLRTPVVVHLLAPNQRPIQTTTDLAGFWVRLYPQVRRELMRRYPKHAWPERPESR